MEVEPKTTQRSHGAIARWGGALIVSLLSAACTVGPNYRPPEIATLKLPDRFQGAPTPAAAIVLRSWWTGFNDPILTNLIDAALAANLDVEAASARLRAARAAVRVARGGKSPAVGISAGANQALVIKGEGSGTNSFQPGVDASWEADIFGAQRRTIEAARANADAVEANLHALQLSIAGEIAFNYIDARNAQARRAIAQRNLEYQDDTVEIAGWRVQAGLVSSLDLEQSRVIRAQTAASLPLFETSYAAAANRIAILIGEAPGAVTARLDGVSPMPRAPDRIESGLPATLLQNRPDVIAAERLLAAETARIGILTTQLYPALRLTGSLSASSLSIGDLGTSVLGGLASSITAPLFQGGRIRAQIEGQNATTDAALAAYRQTVLIALEEVENALVALQNAKRREAALQIAETSAQTSVLYARSQYRAGLIDFATLLESERGLLSSQDGRADAAAARTTAAVQLYKALGGGWREDPLPQDVRR